jgi:hypothetical protein
MHNSIYICFQKEYQYFDAMHKLWALADASRAAFLFIVVAVVVK